MKNLKGILSTITPFLGTMIGGPFGAAAAKILGSVLLDDENAGESAIEQALSAATPEQLAKLRQVDYEYKARMMEVGVTEEKIKALDRQSAREREARTKDKIPAILAVFLTTGFFSMLAALLFIPIPEEAKGVLQVMLGSLGTAWISVITYYFGSSQGSAIKTGMLGEKIK